jgi:hypothetical protein
MKDWEAVSGGLAQLLTIQSSRLTRLHEFGWRIFSGITHPAMPRSHER